ncbi:phosphodiesterase 6G, cGMP-specific, rod, gamma, paralog b isoform X1 [Syngnathoides biaculeatus]|uniref:phosphodiesterase 6G, cGMP-specific, rod, gamma, paralog b isoform X1 n=2 Tax=Syngnathoides biaculeatus TaxID=300417 RepID=UPI002ADE6944|nr:phosphodiesterase 6G, cGMP-specific, rod, gamma, paralog b isoform X1 [Syngnathoides biaculeatus]
MMSSLAVAGEDCDESTWKRITHKRVFLCPSTLLCSFACTRVVVFSQTSVGDMNLEAPKVDIKSATRVSGGPATPRKGPPKFKQRQTRQFKSKPPKKGVQGFGDDIPGMEGLGTDITVICPWEAFNHLELHELAQYGII